MGAARQLAALEGTHPGATVELLLRPVFGCFTADYHGLHSLAEVGEDNICFETDYPHTDTTWPTSKEYAEKMLADFDEKLAYKVLRGNAIKMLELDRT